VHSDAVSSYVERQNFTMRMGMRRFTRLTNGFSKKVANHEVAVALHFLHYDFFRVASGALRDAGDGSSHVWSIVEIVGLLDAADKKAA
jgi:hypothetical protein